MSAHALRAAAGRRCTRGAGALNGRGETTMLIGAHSIIYSKRPEADRAFLRDMLGMPHVDVGEGWLIFGLPPAEVAVHPSGDNDVHEFYLMCDDVHATVVAREEPGDLRGLAPVDRADDWANRAAR